MGKIILVIGNDRVIKTKKVIEAGQELEHEQREEQLDAMKLTLSQRRELMDHIMEESWAAAIESTPYDGNIYDDTDEADETLEKRLQILIQKMLELKKQYGFPIAKYDHMAKRAYIEYSDGRREYLDNQK